jgi:pimeloyl-ACP methyl ester carboxylesterase
VRVGCVDLNVRRTPPKDSSAEPALYVHGLGGASTNFTDLADLLSPWLDGHAIDLPGFGRSGPAPGGDYSIAAHTKTVIGYLEQTGRGPVHLIGNSMGGAISIQVAATRPDLVRSLSLVSPAVPDLRPKKGSDALMPLLLVPGIGSRTLARLNRLAPERRARAVINLCFAHPELVPPNRLAEAAAEIKVRRDYAWAGDAFMRSFRGLVRSYLTVGARSPWHALGQIQAPAVVVWGELDRLVDVANAPRVAKTLADATLLVLPDVGHTAQLEDPVSTARAILSLLTRANNRHRQVGVGV